MHSRTRRILLYLISLSAASACQHADVEKRTRSIDSLQIVMAGVNETMARVDSTALAGAVADIDERGPWIFENLTDTLNRKPGIALGDFMRSKKFFERVLGSRNTVVSEIRLCHSQLEILEKDVENGFFTDSEFQGYLKAEAKAITDLEEAVQKLETNYLKGYSTYKSAQPDVHALHDSLRRVVLSIP